MIGTVVVPVAEFVELFDGQVMCGDLPLFERRLVITALMEQALGNPAGEEILYSLIDSGVVNANTGWYYGCAAANHNVQRLQYHFSDKVTDIGWAYFRNTGVIYSVSVRTGKVLISTRPTCQALSYRPDGR